MTRLPRRHRLRGFSLLEAVLVLTLVGAISGAFVAVVGRSGPLASELAARTTVSAAADTVAALWQRNGQAPAPTCPDGVPAADTGVHNGPVFADPCSLSANDGDVDFTAATTPATGGGDVSVGAAAAPASWSAFVVAAQAPERDQPVTTCHAAVLTLPGAQERYLTFPVPAGGCSAAGAARALQDAVNAGVCTGDAGQSWRRACVLP